MPARPIRNLETHPGGEARARRLPLQLIVRYRPVGEQQWRSARTQNVSRSGLLFLTDEALDVTTAVEMALRFEMDENTARSGEARLIGFVVRHDQMAAGSGMHAIAATIEQHELLPAGLRYLDS